jgi:hypothetical protein
MFRIREEIKQDNKDGLLMQMCLKISSTPSERKTCLFFEIIDIASLLESP